MRLIIAKIICFFAEWAFIIMMGAVLGLAWVCSRPIKLLVWAIETVEDAPPDKGLWGNASEHDSRLL